MIRIGTVLLPAYYVCSYTAHTRRGRDRRKKVNPAVEPGIMLAPAQ